MAKSRGRYSRIIEAQRRSAAIRASFTYMEERNQRKTEELERTHYKIVVGEMARGELMSRALDAIAIYVPRRKRKLAVDYIERAMKQFDQKMARRSTT